MGIGKYIGMLNDLALQYGTLNINKVTTNPNGEGIVVTLQDGKVYSVDIQPFYQNEAEHINIYTEPLGNNIPKDINDVQKLALFLDTMKEFKEGSLMISKSGESWKFEIVDGRLNLYRKESGIWKLKTYFGDSFYTDVFYTNEDYGAYVCIDKDDGIHRNGIRMTTTVKGIDIGDIRNDYTFLSGKKVQRAKIVRTNETIVVNDINTEVQVVNGFSMSFPTPILNEGELFFVKQVEVRNNTAPFKMRFVVTDSEGHQVYSNVSPFEFENGQGFEITTTGQQAFIILKPLYMKPNDTYTVTAYFNTPVSMDGTTASGTFKPYMKLFCDIEVERDILDVDYIIDENDMISNSETKVPTQKSVKTYVDTELAKSPNFIDKIAVAPTIAGTLTGFTTNSITDSTKTFIVDSLVGKVVKIYSDGIYFEYGIVESNTATTIVFDSNFIVSPENGYSYSVIDSVSLTDEDLNTTISLDVTSGDCAVVFPTITSENNRKYVEILYEAGLNTVAILSKGTDKMGGFKFATLVTKGEVMSIKSHLGSPSHWEVISSRNTKRLLTGYWNATEDAGGLNTYTPVTTNSTTLLDNKVRFIALSKSGKNWYKYKSLSPSAIKVTVLLKLIKTGAGDSQLNMALHHYNFSTGVTTPITTRTASIKMGADALTTLAFNGIVNMNYNDEVAIVCSKTGDTFTIQSGSSFILEEV